MTRALVEANGIARRFGHGSRAIEALGSATFVIEAGDQIALVGPSGSGKSTLLNIIAGLDEPTAGTIAWPGIGPREALRPLAVGMIHQFSSLVPTLSVAENVALPLRLGHRMDEAEAVADAISAVGLMEFARRMPSELSGGQAQRAAIARSLSHRPQLLIGDEPTGQLDRVTGQSVLDAILSHVPAWGGAILIATHDPSVAARMRTVWHLDHGNLRVHSTRAAA